MGLLSRHYGTNHLVSENMIYKGLDDDESGFPSFVAKRQAEHDADVIRNEIEEVSAYRVRKYGIICVQHN